MTSKHNLTRAVAVALAGMGALQSGAALAQDVPSQSLGISTGFTYNTNRGLDSPSQGDTFELFSRLDFGLTFATPIQSLRLSGDITLRGLDGAEAGSIPDGLTDPNLRLRYQRTARNAQLTFSAFARETETSTLIAELDGLDLVVVADNATRLTYGFDSSLELGRQAPFGVTLSTGFTGLRYSDTTSTTLLDQDRFRVGASFRFNINPVLTGTLNARLSSFEEDGTPGSRETFTLSGSLEQALPAGRFGLNASIVAVEEGERFSLGTQYSVERATWEIDSGVGLTRSIDGDVFPTANLGVTHTLPAGSLSLDVLREIRSGLSDNEQEFTSVRFGYVQELTPTSSLNVDLSYRETDPTETGGTSSLGTIGLTYRQTLTPDWSMNVGLSHRISRSSAGTKADDSRLSLSIRRSLTAKR